MTEKKKIVVAISGASGSLYAQVLLKKLEALREQLTDVAVVMSDNAKQVWQHEIGDHSYDQFPFRQWARNDFNAPFASGSSSYSAMIVCPCSMGTLGRITSGISNDLTTRAADVMLKERRTLILVTRDTPLSLIHLNNMRAVTQAGGIILPASPSFYSRPESFEQLAATVIDRALALMELKTDTFRWGE